MFASLFLPVSVLVGYLDPRGILKELSKKSFSIILLLTTTIDLELLILLAQHRYLISPVTQCFSSFQSTGHSRYGPISKTPTAF